MFVRFVLKRRTADNPFEQAVEVGYIIESQRVGNVLDGMITDKEHQLCFFDFLLIDVLNRSCFQLFF